MSSKYELSSNDEINTKMVSICFGKLVCTFDHYCSTYFRKEKNSIGMHLPYKVSKGVQEIYYNLPFVDDIHYDALLEDRKLNKKSDCNHVDFPRVEEGNATLQTFTRVNKSPQGQYFNENLLIVKI